MSSLNLDRWEIWNKCLICIVIFAAYIPSWVLMYIGGRMGSSLLGPGCGDPLGQCPNAASIPIHQTKPGDAFITAALIVAFAVAPVCIVCSALVLAIFAGRWETLAEAGAGEDWAAPARGVLGLLAALMPVSRGELWLAEALSVLYEGGPARYQELTRNYQASAPRVILLAWPTALVIAVGRLVRILSKSGHDASR